MGLLYKAARGITLIVLLKLLIDSVYPSNIKAFELTLFEYTSGLVEAILGKRGVHNIVVGILIVFANTVVVGALGSAVWVVLGILKEVRREGRGTVTASA